ncbi:hypothetical protein D3C83_237680 [compost metagenome]
MNFARVLPTAHSRRQLPSHAPSTTGSGLRELLAEATTARPRTAASALATGVTGKPSFFDISAAYFSRLAAVGL